MRIRPAKQTEADWLQDSFAAGMGWQKPVGYFASVLQEQTIGAATLLLALDLGEYLGHCKVNWQPGYPGFRERGIPEIQDLNVIRARRRQGVASRLLGTAEELISRRAEHAGIGFGLYADYGAAQRFYIPRGYVPDGRGVHYHDQPVPPGATVAVDDDLVLYLVKKLGW